MKFYNVTFFVDKNEEAPCAILDDLNDDSSYKYVLKIVNQEAIQGISIFMSKDQLSSLLESLNYIYKTFTEPSNE